MTEFLGSTEANDGYAGNKAVIYLCFDREENRLLAVHRHGYYTLHHFFTESRLFAEFNGYAVGYFTQHGQYKLVSKKFKRLYAAQAVHAGLTELCNFPKTSCGGPLFGIFGSAAI